LTKITYRYVQSTWWSYAPDCGARGPLFDSRLWQGSLCLLFLFLLLLLLLLLCFNIFFVQNTIFIMIFSMFIHLVNLTHCPICKRLERYKDTDLAFLIVGTKNKIRLLYFDNNCVLCVGGGGVEKQMNEKLRRPRNGPAMLFERYIGNVDLS